MPILEHYRHYFDIDPDYFPAVNEAVINQNPDMWKKFFPHSTFVSLIRNTVNVLTRRQKLSLWVEGAYGTGKSHAVLTLKKLLDANDADTREYFQQYGIDKDLCNSLQNVKNSGTILTVHRYGSSNIHGDNDLVLAIQESIDHAFAERGLENKASDSLRSAVIKYLSDPENKQSFNIYVKGSYSSLFGGDDVDTIIEKLKNYSDLALHTLMDKIFKVAKERQIRAFTMDTKDLSNWIREVIKQNSIKAIVFIWDEFTEYFYNNSRNLTGFQELCELSETEPFYFILVTHLSTGLFSDKDRDFDKLNDRFVKPHCQISLPENIAFQLMGAAMEKNKDEEVAKDWADIVDDLTSRTRESRKLVKNAARIEDQELKNIIPIHPYTALLLKHISSAFDSNQRSMFDFIKNDRGDEIKGFQWFIDNYGPEDENPLLTIDMLWEFFYEKGKEYLAHDVRSILDYYTRGGNQKLDPDEKRVLKTVLLLQAISQHAGDSVELFIPNAKNINSAFEGSDLENSASRCADKLVHDKVLFKRKPDDPTSPYNAYINEVSDADLAKFKERIDKRTTTSFITEQLSDNSTVADAVSLNGALKLRYILRYVSLSDFDSQLRQLKNQAETFTNNIAAMVCFAKDDVESVGIGRKISEAVESGSHDIIFIDATTTPFGKDGYVQYRDDMAQSDYQQGKDNSLSTQFANTARDSLKKWKNRISSGEFIVFSADKPSGERATSLDALYGILEEINRSRFPDCLESTYKVLPTMYTASSLKLGVECGANENCRQVFSSSNQATKLENALSGAWKTTGYQNEHPSLPISKLKLFVDSIIHDEFGKNGRVSIKLIYDSLKVAPYGFMPCNLSAFILGFVLKDYLDGSFSWSDGLTNDILDLNKLKEMVAEVINLQLTPNQRYKDKYIVAMTEDEKAFNEATAVAFEISKNLCTSVENTRGMIRNRMKDFTFPIWTVKSILQTKQLSTDSKVIERLIDLYCGMANSGNLAGAMTENDIAMAIGKLCRENPSASEDLRSLLTKENCTAGMQTYLETFENGELITLSKEIGDNGQYINVLRHKFDADAANWVWNSETVDQKIDEVILEYRIIATSNKVISKNISYENTIREWCDKCQYIRISFAAAKNDLDELGAFLGLLCEMKKTGTLKDSDKQRFLDLLTANSEGFRQFYNEQLGLFKRVCAYYIDGFSDDEVRELYLTIPGGTFTSDKPTYLSLVDSKVSEYRSTLGNQQLKKLWHDKTGTANPREWSKEHRMPILCLVPDKDQKDARRAFDTINSARADQTSVDKAINYLGSASFFGIINDEKALDKAFRDSIIKSYSVMLTDIDEVKNYLDSHISAEPYDWFMLPEVEKKIKQMAEAKYNQSGCERALEKIDSMNISDVKRYLKELIKDNMTVGMEIIRS